MATFFKVEFLEMLIMLVWRITFSDVDVSTPIEKYAWSWGNKVIVHTQQPYPILGPFLTHHLEDANQLDWGRTLDAFTEYLLTQGLSFLILVSNLGLSLVSLRLFSWKKLRIDFFIQKFGGKIQKTSINFICVFFNLLTILPK